MILGTYKIDYESGPIQEKNLISNSMYKEVVRPINSAIDYIESLNRGKKTPESIKLRGFVRDTFGEYFTDNSPIFFAIESGVIELNVNQGNHNCKITKVNVLATK